MNGENLYPPLFFFYSLPGKEILFSNLPVASFFESPVDLKTEPPFVKAFGDNNTKNLIKEWQYCLQLKEKETYHFSFERPAANNNLVFDFSVLCAVLSPLDDSPGLLVHVKKAMILNPSNKTATNYQKDYAEFLELAAHDLDAPLRKLSVLVERMVGKIDRVDEIAGYITRIQASLSGMRSMLDGLSTLSAFTSSDLNKESCNIEDIVRGAVSQLPQEDRERVKIFSPLPVLEGDTRQYKQLFKNLLHNAILFSKKETPSIVEICAETLQPKEQMQFNLPIGTAYHKIIITDNGIGFRPEYAEKIFRPFVRLHGKSEYPGHGMGLAICKRIVENHHGIIYAEGNTDEGARFILILPQTII